VEHSYRLWRHKLLPNVCQLDEFAGVEDVTSFEEGVELANGFPSNVTLRMSDRFPDDMLLADNLANTNRLIVISAGLRRFLEDEGVQHIEFLPVTILDHKGRVASADYWILNPVGLVDCLDLDKCQPEWDVIDETKVNHVKSFAMDTSRIDESRRLFRPRYFTKVVLIREDLANRISSQGFTGVQWRDLQEATYL